MKPDDDTVKKQDMADSEDRLRGMSPPDAGDETAPGNTGKKTRRSQTGRRVIMINILCNLALFAGKMIAGTALHSMAVVADAFNNLSDTVSNVIAIIGIHMADEPADREHPFGHGRIEYLTSLLIAMIIVVLGALSAWESVKKIVHPEPSVIGTVAFLFLFISVGVKLFMGFFNRYFGRKTDSSILLTAGLDAFSDVLATGATIVSLILDQVMPFSVDGIAGAIVSVFIIRTGLSMALRASNSLIGQAADPQLIRDVTACIEAQPGVIRVHELLLHSYGPEHTDGSAHIELDRHLSLEEAHRIANSAEKEVRKKWGIHMVIHMDPV